MSILRKFCFATMLFLPFGSVANSESAGGPKCNEIVRKVEDTGDGIKCSVIAWEFQQKCAAKEIQESYWNKLRTSYGIEKNDKKVKSCISAKIYLIRKDLKREDPQKVINRWNSHCIKLTNNGSKVTEGVGAPAKMVGNIARGFVRKVGGIFGKAVPEIIQQSARGVDASCSPPTS